jgi:hypothetical protein
MDEPGEEEEDAPAEDEDELEAEMAEPVAEGDAATPVKRKTRRGSRGGRRRKKPVGAATATTSTEIALRPTTNGGESPAPRIYVPSSDFGRDGQSSQAAKIAPEADAVASEASENGAAADAAAPVKKKTRRGSRGGKNRRKKPAGAATDATTADPGESS